MMPMVEPPTERRAERAAPAAEALLIEQLARATRELRAREAEGRRAGEVRAVIRCLRHTLSRMAQCGSVPDPEPSDFWVQTSPEGEIEVWHRGKRLPLCDRQLEGAFEASGVVLEPGQRILVVRDLVRRSVEESLLNYALQEFRLREAKADLLRVTEELRGPSHHVDRAGEN